MASAAEPRTDNISVGRVISNGFATLRRRALPFFGLSLLLSGLPSFAQQYAMLQFRSSVGAGGEPSLLLSGIPSASYWIGSVVLVVLSFLLQAIILRSAILDQSGRPIDIGGSVGVALRLFFPIIAIAILSWIGIAIGFILLIVPGVILYIMLVVSVPALIEERVGVFGSMSRSRELTKGSRLRIFGLLLLLLAFYFLLSLSSGLLLGSTVSFGLRGFSASQALTSAISEPLVSTMVASLYIELRTVKEGGAAANLADIFA